MSDRRGTPQFIGGGAPLELSTTEHDGRTVVAAVGELDRETAPKLADTLRGAVAQGGNVDLDLSGIGFMDSQGLRVLMEAHKSAADGAVRITEASDQVRRLLAMTGLSETFGVA